MNIKFSPPLLFLFSGMVLVIGGLCVPGPMSVVLVSWGVIFLIIAPVLGVVRNI